jgi:hypothetical protein
VIVDDALMIFSNSSALFIGEQIYKLYCIS